MNLSEYNFCKQYTIEFLAIINYPVDDDTVSLIENSRILTLHEIDSKYKDKTYYNELYYETNKDYDKQLFDYIKENVADVDSEFFNERINNMNRILISNKDYAVRLGMKVPARVISDFYNNYLIALERTLRAELQNTIN